MTQRLRKRDRFHQAIRALNALVCPVCGQPLTRKGEDYGCASGHLFNTHRKGCLHLLNTRPDTVYDAALFEARRRVLQAGCYDEVADAIDRMLPDGPHRLLDAGCGDGWYLNTLLTRHPDWVGAGVDISRDAILHATDQPCEAVWCVADLRRLPFADGTFTAVLDVLTPAAYDSFRRVLTPDGLLVKVYPGADYLRELRQARGMPPYEEGQVDAYLRSHATLLRHERVTVRCAVDAALWRDFVWMTPLNQDLSAAEKDALAATPADAVTIDLHVAACRW